MAIRIIRLGTPRSPDEGPRLALRVELGGATCGEAWLLAEPAIGVPGDSHRPVFVPTVGSTFTPWTSSARTGRIA